MVNKLILLGRVGADPEQTQLTSGIVVNFSLATSEKWKKDGEQREETQWHDIKAFGSLADVISKYVKKGDMLYIEGKVKYTTWEKDGIKRYGTDIICHNMQMLGGKKNDTESEFTG